MGDAARVLSRMEWLVHPATEKREYTRAVRYCGADSMALGAFGFLWRLGDEGFAGIDSSENAVSFLIEYEVLAWRFGGNLLHALACSRKAFCRPSPKSVRVVGSLEDVELAHGPLGPFPWERKFKARTGRNLLSFDASRQCYLLPRG